MVVLSIIGIVVALIIIFALLDLMKDHYNNNYSYSIYNWRVLSILFISGLLFAVFLLGMDGSISLDNRIAAFIIALIIWIAVLAYNIYATSLLAGILVTIFQSIAAIFIAILIFILIYEAAEGRSKNDE